MTEGASERYSDARVLEAWRRNASPWTRAVRERRIESRRLVTDQAILDAVTGRAPRSALDLGCGEGWLVRALAERGVHALGVDAIPELIGQAERAGAGAYRVASYEEIAEGALDDVRVDVVVANFALIGGEAVDALVRRVASLLEPRGALVVQTLHPWVANVDDAYADGWRPGSWAGIAGAFSEPAPWYFRTLETWVRLFSASGLRVVEMREPMHPVTRRPASVVFVAEVASAR